MDLPRIVNPQPVVIPARDQEQYNDSYIVGINLDTYDDNPLNQSISLSFQPYDFDAKKLLVGGAKHTVGVANIWEEAQQSNLFAQSMGMLVFVANLVLQRDTVAKQLAACQSFAVWPSRETTQQQLDDLLEQIEIQGSTPELEAEVLRLQTRLQALTQNDEQIAVLQSQLDGLQSVLNASSVAEAIGLLQG